MISAFGVEHVSKAGWGVARVSSGVKVPTASAGGPLRRSSGVKMKQHGRRRSSAPTAYGPKAGVKMLGSQRTLPGSGSMVPRPGAGSPTFTPRSAPSGGARPQSGPAPSGPPRGGPSAGPLVRTTPLTGSGAPSAAQPGGLSRNQKIGIGAGAAGVGVAGGGAAAYSHNKKVSKNMSISAFGVDHGEVSKSLVPMRGAVELGNRIKPGMSRGKKIAIGAGAAGAAAGVGGAAYGVNRKVSKADADRYKRLAARGKGRQSEIGTGVLGGALGGPGAAVGGAYYGKKGRKTRTAVNAGVRSSAEGGLGALLGNAAGLAVTRGRSGGGTVGQSIGGGIGGAHGAYASIGNSRKKGWLTK